MTHTSSTPGMTVHYDFTAWHKPLGRGRRFDRMARGLARRMRLWIVRDTKWEQAHPYHDLGRRVAISYGPPWMSDHALADYSFACECHRNVRYQRNARSRKAREGRPQ